MSEKKDDGCNMDCPACGSRAYQGCGPIECSNRPCVNYPKHKLEEFAKEETKEVKLGAGHECCGGGEGYCDSDPNSNNGTFYYSIYSPDIFFGKNTHLVSYPEDLPIGDHLFVAIPQDNTAALSHADFKPCVSREFIISSKVEKENIGWQKFTPFSKFAHEVGEFVKDFNRGINCAKRFDRYKKWADDKFGSFHTTIQAPSAQIGKLSETTITFPTNKNTPENIVIALPDVQALSKLKFEINGKTYQLGTIHPVDYMHNDVSSVAVFLKEVASDNELEADQVVADPNLRISYGTGDITSKEVRVSKKLTPYQEELLARKRHTEYADKVLEGLLKDRR